MTSPLFNTLPAFGKLEKHAQTASSWQMRDLFSAEANRFGTFSVSAAGLFLDYSKNRVNSETLSLLMQLACECRVEEKREAMFAGEIFNNTEHRAVLHTALRAPRSDTVRFEGQNVMPEVHAVLDRVAAFTRRIHSGEWTGYTGKRMTDVINIGIGGSDLGPHMVCQALRPWHRDDIRVHFVSNVDGHDLDAVLKQVRPETSLFIVASKTFTTLETMLNANTARNWFLQGATEADLPRHFVAISTNAEAVSAFGIHTDNMFPFWDWVGGRYSVWSAIGLSVALAIGYDHFAEFLAGAYAMDVHFKNAALENNMPVILALIGIWNRNFLDYPSVSIAPYLQDLAYFPSYLQQLEMESNGKRVTKAGIPVSWHTSPVVWGNVGTNGQHAYFQLLHQGTDITPIDFIAALRPSHTLPHHHAALLANCFAQSEALMLGKTADEVRADLQAQNMAEDEIEFQIPHRTFPGNRPSNTLLMNILRPESLGALVALYEHKTFVQGAIWDVNPFDQWGVELGKVLAKTIQEELEGNATHPHDSSTAGLISLARAALN
ncbi:glucose-6-phosphate isomerase [Oxalobacter vibrioformis]|uniref:Glucose-6-phosphate isomerase n=1 Tax=Oxalobacter vibrioformis TaxID=933080 RepID=A0A9E9LXV5_9BURK|nr:glucose-6-phosphate isomerase [Oxalobacter vibrioformis]WAW09472.1 glucose-6-phosphate isomerase [Oxalobacter vibrioformis]